MACHLGSMFPERGVIHTEWEGLVTMRATMRITEWEELITVRSRTKPQGFFLFLTVMCGVTV